MLKRHPSITCAEGIASNEIWVSATKHTHFNIDTVFAAKGEHLKSLGWTGGAILLNFLVHLAIATILLQFEFEAPFVHASFARKHQACESWV